MTACAFNFVGYLTVSYSQEIVHPGTPVVGGMA